MELIKKKDQWPAWLMQLFVFFLPNLQQVSVILIPVMILAWIFLRQPGQKIGKTLSDKIILLFLSYYFIHVIGMLYSDNLAYGFFDLQVKLSFLVFPILIPGISNPQMEWKKIRNAFIAGNALAAGWCLVSACISFVQSHDVQRFFYVNYSRLMHPAYFSMYLNVAIIFLLEILISGNQKSFKEKFGLLILIFFFFITIFLLSSRTAIATSYITVAV